MQHANYPPKRLRFGVFEADPRLGELTKHGRRLPLQEQPFQLLAMLLERPGELVSREELRAKIWPQTIVDFDHGLNKAISKIRDVLGDSAENPRFIETVARRGYRFLADVAVVGKARPARAIDEGAAAADAPVSSERPHALPWRGLGIALAVLVVLTLSWALYRRQDSGPVIRSLAVLPLANFSNDKSQDYFADGMTEELITHLGQISA